MPFVLGRMQVRLPLIEEKIFIELGSLLFQRNITVTPDAGGCGFASQGPHLKDTEIGIVCSTLTLFLLFFGRPCFVLSLS